MTRYLIAAGIVSLAAAIFGAVGLVEPLRLGWTAPAPTWVKLCLAMLLALPVLWLLVFRHQLQLGWALTDESPVAMYAHVEVEDNSQSAGYYVCLRAAPDAPVLHRVAVQRPHGSLDTLRMPHAAQVFIDRRSGKPLVVEVAGHRLWSLVA